MTFDQQVCAFEYAKRLRELGVRQESLLCYCTDYNPAEIDFLPTEYRNEEVCIAAFTVAELLEMLPACFDFTYFSLIKGNDISDGYVYIARYNSLDSPDKNPANACAKMLIYLIEQGDVKI